MITRSFSILFVAAVAMISTPLATAVPVSVVYDNATTCDPLGSGKDVHELGLGLASGLTGLFPLDEEITAVATGTILSACPASDLPAVPNTLVVMTNLTGIDWRQVWYVADPDPLGTTISNVDGTVNAGQAFLIDSIGLNRPLVLETMTPDGVFEAGETWEFIIDDYVSSFGGPASDFLSVGLVGFPSSGDPLFSTGSIIAIPVPEPATCMLLLIGLGLVVTGRRS